LEKAEELLDQKAEELLDPDVETATPGGTRRGIAACRRIVVKASGDEQFSVEQAEPDFEEIEGEIVAGTHEIARWRETGEIAYEREFALLLTLDTYWPARCLRRNSATNCIGLEVPSSNLGAPMI
jgi:hypothetical protein